MTAQQAQKALDALRRRTPPLVRKSSRGEYAVESGFPVFKPGKDAALIGLEDIKQDED